MKGVEEMNYRVVEKEAFRIVGVSQPLHKELEQNFMIVPNMWQQAAADGTIGRLAAMMNSQPMGLLGVSVCNDEEEWRYYICLLYTSFRNFLLAPCAALGGRIRPNVRKVHLCSSIGKYDLLNKNTPLRIALRRERCV